MNLAEFARWVIENGGFAGHDLDCMAVLEKAKVCGLVEEMPYDPKAHGQIEDAFPGDPYFVFTNSFSDPDARLCAAAPELLAALEGVVAVADRNTDEFNRARAAIAKATQLTRC